MAARVLIAGVGNVYFADHGFGVEVARRLLGQSLPFGAAAVEVGVRALHLSRALRSPLELLVVAEVLSHGAAPGTLYLLDPLDDLSSTSSDLRLVLSAARATGTSPGRVAIIGCEPGDLGARLGLSPPVREAIAPAVELVQRLAERQLATVVGPRH